MDDRDGVVTDVDLSEERPWRPLRLPEAVRKHALSRRATSLLVLSMLSLVWGIGLLLQPPRGRTRSLYDVLFSLFTPKAWAVIWIVVGVFAGTVSLTRHPKDRIAFGAVSTLFATWAAGALIDWLQYGVQRGWVVPALLGLIALLVIVIAGWPE